MTLPERISGAIGTCTTVETGHGSAGIECFTVWTVETWFTEARVGTVGIQAATAIGTETRQRSTFVDIDTSRTTHILFHDRLHSSREYVRSHSILKSNGTLALVRIDSSGGTFPNQTRIFFANVDFARFPIVSV